MIDIASLTPYMENGIIVHPLVPVILGNRDTGKAPIVKGWESRTTQYDIAYLKRTLADGANIGANCGKASDLTVIDIDCYIKGIWEYIFADIDTSNFVTQQRTEKDGKKHYLFKYSPLLKTCTNQELGFDIRNDGGNIVLSPSVHYEGDVYKLLAPIETRTELPEVVTERVNFIISTYAQLKATFVKCRPCFFKLWKAVFTDNSSDLYHDVTIFRRADGRLRHLALFAELKANGATDEQLMLACMLIFGEFYDDTQTDKGISKIEPKTAKNATLQADEYYSRFMGNVTDFSDKTNDTCTGSPFRELTSDEIQARKDILKDRRLPLVLPANHFVSVYCDWLGGLTDGYEDYQKLGALWLISAFCNSNVVVKLKQETVRPNIFVTLFGRSTTSRKSTSVQRTRQIYESVTGEYLPNEDFSIEGYLESLAANPTQHHVRDEVAGFLAKIHKQYNEGFNELECALYDGQNFRKTLASKGAKEPKVFDIRNPYVTKLYATTPDNYLKYMTVEDFLCGKEYRTLFCFPNYTKNKMPLGVETTEDIKKWTLVLERASEIHHFIKNSGEIKFSFDADALAYYSQVTSLLEDAADKTDNGMLCSAVGRSQIHMLKLAMLIELGKYPISTTITRDSIIIAANMVIDYFIPTIMDVVDRLQEDVKNNMVEKVISVIRRCGGAVQHTKALHDAKLKSKDFAEVISTLEESETIEAVIETKTKKVFYILTEMKMSMDLSTFENLPNLPNLRDLSISDGKKSGEILETLKNIRLSTHVCKEDENHINTCDSLPCEVKQSKKYLSLQNLSHVSTSGDEETQEIREISEIENIETVEQYDVVTDQNALKFFDEEGL